jgi:conjugative transfer pilus assembly protein TraH
MINSIRLFWFIMIIFLIAPISSFAGLNKSLDNDLDNYFQGLGFSTNTTSPQAYHGQQAGYYTGGSLFMRSTVKDLQIMQVDLPSYRSGCSGIDVFAGGFSFVDSEQLTQMFQKIMNHAGSYAFTLALETATPVLANVTSKIHSIANTINQANINDCQTAESLVGGMWPRTRESQQQVCKDIGNSKTIFSDWAEANQKCGMGDEFSKTMDVGRRDPQYKNRVFDSGNVTWKALKKNNLVSSDTELSEFLMSLSGTVIISKNGAGDDSPTGYQTLPSLMDVQKNNLVKALLEGEEVTIYHCDTTDEDGCLHPTPTGKVSASHDKAFANRIRKLLEDMVSRIIEDSAITNEEIGLLQSTSLPIYKMLNVQVAFAKDKDFLQIPNYADAIATDILYQYLEQSLQIIRNSVAASQSPEDILGKLQPSIDKELEFLRFEQKDAYSRMATSLQLIQQTQVIERMLAGSLSSELSSNLSWARGLK